jgi:4-hydroxy-tetrahydrodipicolinate synthase
MKKSPHFSGVVAPVLTPFDDKGNPDKKRFIAHAKWCLEDGCTALAPFGTTSEATSLGLEERIDLLETLIASGIDARRLMPGNGTPNIPDTVKLTKHGLSQGVGAFLTLPPYYYKNMSDEGIFRFFAEVIERVGDKKLRLYLYHIPPQAVLGFSLPLIGRLIKAYPETVVGLKDSTGDWKSTEAILKEYASTGFEVFPGAETSMLPAMRMGGVGCISATANVAARNIRSVFDNWQSKDADAAQEKIAATRKAIQAYPVIPVMKAMIAHYRNDPGWNRVRPPFVALTAAEAEKAIADLAGKHGFRLDFKQKAA